MKNRIVVIFGVILILGVLLSVIVFKVSGSVDSTYIEGCTPYNIDIKRGESSTVNIIWKTKDKCSGYIVYGSEMKDLDMVAVDLDNEITSKEHQVVIKGLVSSKEYYFSIVSDDIDYGKSGLPLRFSIDSL